MKRDHFIAACFMLLTVLSRMSFVEKDFGGISYDSGSYRLAVQSYDLTQTRPHLPGYYLHVKAIKLVRLITGNTHLAMLALSVLYSALAMGFLYLLVRRWLDPATAVLVTGVTLTNPIVWFHGCVTEIYAFDLFFSVVLVRLCLGRRAIYLSPFFLGFLSGVRPSSGFLMLPLYLWFWYRQIKGGSTQVGKALLSQCSGLVGFLLWFVPMIASVGGLGNYLSLYSTHYPVPKMSLLQNWFRFSSLAVFLLLPFLMVLGYVIIDYFRKPAVSRQIRLKSAMPNDFLQTVYWWLIPPAIFFVFVHYSKGYFLICSAALFSLSALYLRGRSAKFPVLGLAIIAQILIFVFLPYRPPDLETIISPAKRKLNVAQVWWERTNSVYLMAQSHIRALENAAETIEEMFVSPASQVPDLDKLVFLDPTFPLSIRSMQVKYPERRFARLSYNKKDHYEVYSGLIEKTETGWENMMREALIVSRTDFVRSALKSFRLQVYRSEEFTLFTVRLEESVELAACYGALFSRT